MRAPKSSPARKASTKTLLVVTTLLATVLAIVSWNYARTTSQLPSPSMDLPSLVGLHALVHPSPAAQPASQLEAALIRQYPHSVLAYYRALPAACAHHVYRPHLHRALSRYGAARAATPDLDHAVLQEDTLLLHLVSKLPSGSKQASLSDAFLRDVQSCARKFKRVEVLSFADHGATAEIAASDAALLSAKLRETGVSVSVHISKSYDEDLYQMFQAQHLLVHRTGYSALGALASRGTVYYTSELSNYSSQNRFKWLLTNGQSLSEAAPAETRVWLNEMGPVQPSCCKLGAFGDGDGEKVLCENAKSFSKAEKEACWVLSVGSNNQWHFEHGIGKRTKCHIHTFDCTGDYRVPDGLRGRATFHKLCLGREKDERKDYIGWNEMLDIGQKQSGPGVGHLPAAAKIDIEGWEMPVLNDVVARGDASALPEQLAIEVHLTTLLMVGPPYVKNKEGPDRMSLERGSLRSWFHNMSKVGYQLVHRADNPFCPTCSEVTLVLQSGLPGRERIVR